MKEQITRYKV